MLHLLHRATLPSIHNGYRPHLLRRGAIAALLGIIVAVEGYFVVGHLRLLSGSPVLATVVASNIISLTNTERAQSYLPTLTENKLLDQAAAAKAADMVAKGYFAHTAPDGTTPWSWIESTGYTYKDAGENLAVRFSDSSAVVDAWMASPSHRANVLGTEYTEIGVGAADGVYQGKQTTFVVQYFARPANAGEVLGASITSVTQSSLDFVKAKFTNFSNYVQANPLSTSSFVLGALLVLVLLAGVATLVFHVSVFPALELAGAFTLAVTLGAFIYINNSLFTDGALPGDFAASVAAAPVVIHQTEQGELPLIASTSTSAH